MPSVISNTGPILALAHLRQLELLHALFDHILIPPAVKAEIQDVTSVTALAAANWIAVQPPQDELAVQLLREELDAGESEAIVLAKELSAGLILIDERAAARRARQVGLSVVGTLGVLLLAKQRGQIALLHPLLEELRQSGFYMSAELYRMVLSTAGEAAGEAAAE